MSERRVTVIGGGLAGIAAAVRLADAGLPVELIETRKRLGGRATSFTDPKTGLTLDNCQHVLLGCCTHLLELYRHLGVEHRIEWHRRLYFQDGAGRCDVLEADDLPAPLHMTAALMSFRILSWSEKYAIARAMYSAIRMGRAGREKLHGMSFGDWLRQHRQPQRAIERFWIPITVSAVNEWPDDTAADAALQVFQEGLLANEEAYAMGLATIPLADLYDPAIERIEAAGGVVRLGVSADRFDAGAHRVNALHTDEGAIEPEVFISALPFDRLAKLITPQMAEVDPRLTHLEKLRVSPIIGIHIWYDQPVTDLPHVALVDSPLQWVFNKGATPRGDGEIAYQMHGVLSAAHDWVGATSDDILDMADRELRNAFPRMAAAHRLGGTVVKEKRATFSARPSVGRFRPDATGMLGNLFLAGDWTNTGWPATMEGATRSGNRAANLALKMLGEPTQPLPDDLPPSDLYALISA